MPQWEAWRQYRLRLARDFLSAKMREFKERLHDELRLARDFLSAKIARMRIVRSWELRLARDFLSAKILFLVHERQCSCGWRAISYRLKSVSRMYTENWHIAKPSSNKKLRN